MSIRVTRSRVFVSKYLTFISTGLNIVLRLTFYILNLNAFYVVKRISVAKKKFFFILKIKLNFKKMSETLSDMGKAEAEKEFYEFTLDSIKDNCMYFLNLFRIC